MRFGRTAAGRGADLTSPARMVTAPPEPGLARRARGREPRAGIVAGSAADPGLVREATPRVSLEQVAQAIDRFLADGVRALDPELDAALARGATELEHGRVDVRLLA